MKYILTFLIITLLIQGCSPLISLEDMKEETKSEQNIKINTIGNTGGNIVNGGLAAIQGDWIYYTLILNGMYKIKTDGTERTKLNNDLSMFINVVGDWIYYGTFIIIDEIPIDDYAVEEITEDRLYKIKTDGTERTRLIDPSGLFFNVVGDWIYYGNYSDGDKLYKIKIDGTGKTKLSEDKVDYTNIVRDWIFYDNVSKGKLCRIKIDGTDREEME